MRVARIIAGDGGGGGGRGRGHKSNPTSWYGFQMILSHITIKLHGDDKQHESEFDLRNSKLVAILTSSWQSSHDKALID